MGLIRTWKKRLGYYEARRNYLRAPFRRALRPDDAFLVGHPKSGNTWLAYMVAILIQGEAHERVTLKNVAEFVPFVHGRDDKIRRYAGLPDPRLFRNENPQYPELYPRTIYLIRDPRAVLVSFWHMYQVMFDDQALSLEGFIDQYMSMTGIFETWNSKLTRWDRQVADYLGRSRADDRILSVRYEDMIGHRRTCLERVAGFLSLRDDGIEIADQRGSFDSMRQVEDKFGAEAYEGKARGDGKFVRVGKIDSWREEMPPAVASRIENEFGPVMEQAGYS
jgi:Sulfotransferase domain